MIENPMVLADPEPERYPECPLCDEECETLFISDENEVLGCEHCVSKKDSWEWAADLEKAEQDEKEYWQERKYEEMRDRQCS